MTISNPPQTHSNGTKRNGEHPKGKEPEAKNGEAAKTKQPESPQGGSKVSTKESGAAKKQAQPKSTPAPELPRPLRVLGFRGHCQEEEHFPTTSLLFLDLDSMKKWVGTMADTLMHVNCPWKAEQVFVGEDGHLYSRVGEMDEEHPGTALIEWSINPPFDLGPLLSGSLPELSQEIKAALAEAKAAKTETEPATETKPAAKANGEPSKKPIGESSPAPKPGERNTSAKSNRPKSAPTRRLPTRALRMKSASKHAKRG